MAAPRGLAPSDDQMELASLRPGSFLGMLAPCAGKRSWPRWTTGPGETHGALRTSPTAGRRAGPAPNVRPPCNDAHQCTPCTDCAASVQRLHLQRHLASSKHPLRPMGSKNSYSCTSCTLFVSLGGLFTRPASGCGLSIVG